MSEEQIEVKQEDIINGLASQLAIREVALAKSEAAAKAILDAYNKMRGEMQKLAEAYNQAKEELAALYTSPGEKDGNTIDTVAKEVKSLD